MFIRITLILLLFASFLCLPLRGEGLDSLFLDPRDASCTDRCHVNSLSYRNDFEGEVFRHATHSSLALETSASGGQGYSSWSGLNPVPRGLHCTDCHEDKEVHTEGHGRLIIDREDCLGCHHVDNKRERCARCHGDIDARPMEYQGKPFVHGFTAESDFDCRECHLADPKSSIKEGINCNKCHHTRPRVACQWCHEESLGKVYYPRPVQMNHLGWTTGFLHSQHPESRLSCQECHPPRDDRAKGVGEYQAHCGECHHKEKPDMSPPAPGVADKGADCKGCHQAVFQFFEGSLSVEGIKPVPDKMSRVLRCGDCHKPLEGGGGFSEVRGECARCHNEHYAELLGAQKGAILSWLDRLRKDLATSSPWCAVGVNTQERDYGEAVAFDPLPEAGPGPFWFRAGLWQGLGLLDFVERYGLHNVSYSREILSFLEKNSQALALESLPGGMH